MGRFLQEKQQKKHRNSSVVLGVALAGGAAATLVLILVVLLVLLLIRRRYQKNKQRTSPADLRKFSYRELKSATNAFNNSNKLGHGGFGSVFRGTLRGLTVAIKRLDTASLQGEREFANELAIMSALSTGANHPPNVVKLLGYCSDSKHHRLLVYEYMANRSLQEALFGKTEAGSSSAGVVAGGRRKLDWNKRMGVLLDVARALAFLHKCDPPIVHGDVKPSNVLLGEEMRAKLADFGLARIKAEHVVEVVENESKVSKPGSSTQQQQMQMRREDDKATSPPVGSPRVVGDGATSSSLMNNTNPTLGVGVEDDDDNWSKQSASASAFDGTEGETWSKVSPSEEIDCRSEVSIESSGHIGRKTGRKKRWWVKDGTSTVPTDKDDGSSGAVTTGGGGSFREYMLDWVDRGRGKSRTADEHKQKTKKKQARSGSLEWWAECDDDGRELARRIKSEQKRKRKLQNAGVDAGGNGNPIGGTTVDHSGELTGSDESFTFYRHSGDLTTEGADGRRRVRTASRDWWSGEMQRGRELWSGELVTSSKRTGYSRRFRQRSRSNSDIWTTVSSTPSMRGTVCYVAPEYGGGGLMTDKSDVYSFGVLVLVVVSGRRPLQVLAAPLSEFERANLISWARHASHAGRPLDIVDSALGGEFPADQAAMCVSLALLCLQRTPASRPSMGDVVKIMSGEAELPSLPFEFSPSPAKCGATSSNRRKRSNNEAAAVVPDFSMLSASS